MDSKSSIIGYSCMPIFEELVLNVPGIGLLGEQPLHDRKEKKELFPAGGLSFTMTEWVPEALMFNLGEVRLGCPLSSPHKKLVFGD